jgi:hypothetical protein
MTTRSSTRRSLLARLALFSRSTKVCPNGDSFPTSSLLRKPSPGHVQFGAKDHAAKRSNHCHHDHQHHHESVGQTNNKIHDITEGFLSRRGRLRRQRLHIDRGGPIQINNNLIYRTVMLST